MENNITKNLTVLVVGATGVLGVEVCRQLAPAAKKVKGLVRTSSQKEKVDGLHELGVETITGDMKDPQSLYQAFQNVDAIITTATSTISHQEGDSIETVDLAGQLNVAEAASTAGVKHVVFISFPPYPPITPEFPLQSAKRVVENRLRSKNFTYTILQPTYFMDIWLGPAMGFDRVRAKAVIYGDGKNKISWIAIKDVASFAVASLDNPAAQNAVIQLGGPDDLSVLDAVRIFEQESGQTFELQNIPDQELRAQMAAAPDSLGKAFRGLMIGLNEVGTIDMKETLRNFPIQLTSVREYAKQMISMALSRMFEDVLFSRETRFSQVSSLNVGSIPAGDVKFSLQATYGIYWSELLVE
jgi:uncharacterized protein YbjT (DUF2867 family)